MEIVFYPSFNKRQNSTKIPTDGGQSFSGEMVEPFDMTAPTLRFSFPAGFAPYSYGFCFINSLGGRYYHVTEWTYESGFWIASLVCDVLASFRDDIFNTSGFVIYSASNYNQLVPDARLSTYATPVHSQQVANLSPGIWGGGCYAVTVLGKGGGTQTYVLSYSALGDLIDAMSIADATEFQDQMQQLFAGASINAILTACWIPFDINTAGGENPDTTIYIANWNSGVAAKYAALTVQAKATIPLNFGGADDFRKSSMYLSAELWLPFIGKTALPIDEISGSTSLEIAYTFDVSTANFIAIVSGNNGGRFSYSGKFGHTIPISAISVNPLQGAIDTATAAASVAHLNFGGAVSSAFDAFQNFSFPTASTVGNVDSKALIGGFNSTYNAFFAGQVVLDWYLTSTVTTPQEVAPVIGYPLGQVRRIGSLSGYVQTVQASVAAGLESENVQINTLLDGGVYLE